MNAEQIEDMANAVIARFLEYGTARDRAVDTEPRTIEVTDDEAIALLVVIGIELA